MPSDKILSVNSLNFNPDSFWQHVIAIDVQFNTWRHFGNHLKILYIKRRNQLFRELCKNELSHFRLRYIKLRYNILNRKYHPVNENRRKPSHMRNSSGSSFLSFIYENVHQNLCGSSGDQLQTQCPSVPSLTLTPEVLFADVHATSDLQSTAFCLDYSFSGVHHIFDQHKDSVNMIKFANKDKSLLCAASTDGTLSLCQLTPSPATILFVLRGHKETISCFEWSHSNDLIVSCSHDATLRLWSATNGNCLRVFQDPQGASILTCAFHPKNNNMLVTGNACGTVNILNLSTGIYSKNCVSVCDDQIGAICFQSNGQLLWVGDFKGFISTFRFEMEFCRLVLLSKVIIVAGSPITSLATLCHNQEDLLLANCACNAVVLFKYPRGNLNHSLEFIKSFPIEHKNRNLHIKSAFCPNSTKSDMNVCIVTGSEDTCVYFYALETFNKSRCVNKLQGHSAPVLDVCFNYEESLLASADLKGNIIIWKRDSL